MVLQDLTQDQLPVLPNFSGVWKLNVERSVVEDGIQSVSWRAKRTSDGQVRRGHLSAVSGHSFSAPRPPSTRV